MESITFFDFLLGFDFPGICVESLEVGLEATTSEDFHQNCLAAG